MAPFLTTVLLVPKKPKSENDCIVMSRQLFEHFQLKKDQEIDVLLGKKSINMIVQMVEIAPTEIILSENIFNHLSLPIQPYKLQANFNQDNQTLQLGPIIGLLTDFSSNEEGVPHFRSVHMFCEELHQGIKEKGGFFFVFAYNQFPNKGYCLDNGDWVITEPPLPDVIYNRIHSRRLEQTSLFKRFHTLLDELNIPIFNDRFLSKWEVHERLLQKSQQPSFLPETRIFSRENLTEFAKRFETVFIKPINGSQGRNIYKLNKKKDNSYTYQSSFQSKSDYNEKPCTLDEIYQQINHGLKNRIYIIQQGIPLVTHNGGVMDFRVLCHKNLQNHWDVTSVVARISAEQEFVSNIARGGRIMKPLNALTACMSKTKAMEVLALMKELSIETASIISQFSSGITGELGIDIGVDLSGKPWLIEVNSKPSKSFEDGQVKIRPSAKAIIQYCTLLAFDTVIK